jgi:hypothetical protein
MIQIETKTILLTLTYLVGAGELILAIFFWVTHSKNEIRKVMALLAFSTGMWVILSGITSYVPYSTLGHYEMALLYISGALLLTALLHLSLIMPYPFIRIDRLHVFLMYFPSVLLSYILIFSRTIVESFDGSSTWAGVVIGGPLYSLYNIYSFLLFTLAISIIFFRIQRLDGLHKKNMQIVVWSVLLGGLPAVVLFLILPIFTPSININSLFGVIPSAVWVGGTTYIIIKK